MRPDIKSYLDAVMRDNAVYIIEADVTVAYYINKDAAANMYLNYFDEEEIDDLVPSAEQVNEFKKYLFKYYNFKL